MSRKKTGMDAEIKKDKYMLKKHSVDSDWCHRNTSGSASKWNSDLIRALNRLHLKAQRRIGMFCCKLIFLPTIDCSLSLVSHKWFGRGTGRGGRRRQA